MKPRDHHTHRNPFIRRSSCCSNSNPTPLTLWSITAHPPLHRKSNLHKFREEHLPIQIPRKEPHGRSKRLALDQNGLPSQIPIQHPPAPLPSNRPFHCPFLPKSTPLPKPRHPLRRSPQFIPLLRSARRRSNVTKTTPQIAEQRLREVAGEDDPGSSRIVLVEEDFRAIG
jgi:hypothetical protein